MLQRKLLLFPLFLLVFTFLVLELAEPQNVGQFDLAHFWASSKYFLSGENPYDQQNISSLVQELLGKSHPLIRFWHPPSAFSFIFWFSWVEFEAFWKFWFCLCVALFAFVTLLLFQNYAEKSSGFTIGARHLLFLLTFPAFYNSLNWGQVTPIILFALTIFCVLIHNYSEKFTGSFTAGLLLSITSFKPHLLYLLYFFIILASIKQKNSKTVIGLACGSLLFLFVPLVVSPQLLSWYHSALAEPPTYWKNPTLGAWLFLIDGQRFPLLCWIPAILALLIVGWFVFRNRIALISDNALHLIVPLSLITTPYIWLYDFILLVPALVWLLNRHFSRLTFYILLAANIVFGIFVQVMFLYFLYPILVFLLVYANSRR